MTTSGVTTGLLTAGAIILTSCKLISEVTSGDDLTADEYDDGVTLLNFMLKSWGATANLWRELDIDLDWPLDTRECTLSPTVLNVIDLRYTDGTTERQLQRYEKERYNQIPDKDQSGTVPLGFNFTKETGNPRIRLWPVPDSAIDLVATVERTAEDVTSIGQTVDIPQEWTECVYFNLATRMAAVMGKHRADPLLVADVKANAKSLFDRLSGPDHAGSVFFTPDQG